MDTKLFNPVPCYLLLLILWSCGGPKDTVENVSDSILPAQISSAGTNIAYQICGSDEPTLLFIHGWCIDKSYWSYQSDGFCSSYRIVTVDLPGFGSSGKNRDHWSIEQYGSDINAVIEQLQLDQVILIGHSMGGDIMLEAALKNDKVLALVGVDNFKDVGLKFDKDLMAEIQGFLEVLESNYSEVSTAYAEGALFHPATDTMVINRVVHDILDVDSLVAVKTLRGLFDYTPNESNRLGKLKQTLYLINSSSTPTDTAALSATGVKFQIYEISGTGHYPMIEKPGEFNQKLKLVLDDIRSEI